MSSPLELVFGWESESENSGSVPLMLHRKPNPGQPPVLLLHGASASHASFTFPPGRRRSLVDWLHAEGFEPWLLDWRGSALVVKKAHETGVLKGAWRTFDLDKAASDVAEAIARLRQKIEEESNAPLGRIGLVGHCLGAAVLAQAIANGDVDPKEIPMHVVLQTIGLFYEARQENELKSQEYEVEKVLAREEYFEIDPHHLEEWPPRLQDLYREWLGRRPHQRGPDDPAGSAELCNRISFLYGQPYIESKLVPSVHHATAELGFRDGQVEPAAGDPVQGRGSNASGVVEEVIPSAGSWQEGTQEGVLVVRRERGDFEAGETLSIANTPIATCVSVEGVGPALADQFGAIPLKLYAHGGRNLRRGWAAHFDADEEDDRSLIGSEARERFFGLERLLLLTGDDNPLWHRGCIDHMFEWLGQGPRRLPDGFRKRVLPGYGHQDLLWGRHAAEEVFPLIRAVLEP
jgi:hypothetical protein